MVAGVVGGDGAVAELLVHERDGVEVVDVGAPVADGGGGRLLVGDEARGRVDEAARLPWRVGKDLCVSEESLMEGRGKRRYVVR